MPVRETIIPGTIRYQRCARCGKELGEICSLDDYDPGALCRGCKAEKAREDDLAEAQMEVLDWVDGELAKRRDVPRTFRESLWWAGLKQFHLEEQV